QLNVNCVAPGWVDTEMSAQPYGRDTGEGRREIEDTIPVGRAASAEDIAGPIVFPRSDLARDMTGEVLNVNGGSVRGGRYERGSSTARWRYSTGTSGPTRSPRSAGTSAPTAGTPWWSSASRSPTTSPGATSRSTRSPTIRSGTNGATPSRAPTTWPRN